MRPPPGGREEAQQRRRIRHAGRPRYFPVDGKIPSEGELIHGYTSERKIAHGAFGVVLAAKDSAGSALCIKKVCHDPRTKNLELDILLELEHPNCLKLLDHFILREGGETYLYIVTRLCSGSVASLVGMGMGLNLALMIAYQLFCALNHLHSKRIVHRDVKPRNLLFDVPGGEAILCDFGTSRKIRPNDESISYIGTRDYRAPELLFGSMHYGPAVDVWAAGCVLFELLLRRRPFVADSLDALRRDMVRALGTPTAQDYEDMQVGEVPHGQPRAGSGLTGVDDLPRPVKDLIDQIFVYSPAGRITAEAAARHACFSQVREGRLKYGDDQWIPPDALE
jgi:serine/threonine protein kinase